MTIDGEVIPVLARVPEKPQARLMGSSATGMATDKELIKEAGQELWNTVKKLRPGLPKEARSQLVLKALLTIGDLPDQLQASMVLGQIADQEPDEAPEKEGAKS